MFNKTKGATAQWFNGSKGYAKVFDVLTHPRGLSKSSFKHPLTAGKKSFWDIFID
jgi:hypothetical protein